MFQGINWEKEIILAEKLAREGKTLQEIGNYFNISKQWVSKLFKIYKIDIINKCSGVKRERKHKERADKESARYKGDKNMPYYTQKYDKYLCKKNNAKNNGIPFLIQFRDIEWPVVCPILGYLLDYTCNGKKQNAPSFDRVDPEIGYTKENTKIISFRANRLKDNGTIIEHQAIIDYMLKFI